MRDRSAAGWVYVLTHPAWDRIGMVKIGKTGRDPRRRAAEITSVSGLLAPCTIACCAPVSDMEAAEVAVHRMLDGHRVRKRRELFRVDATTARQVVEAVARSVPLSRSPLAFLARRRAAPRPAGRRYSRKPRRFGTWRHARHRVSMPVRLVAGVAAIGAVIVLLKPLLLP
jgi:T5orf172 domain